MRILITGICGFAGSVLARSLLAHRENLTLLGIDNLSRPGSETNLAPLRALGCRIEIADLRTPGVLSQTGPIDWLIDAAAEPSVLAGLSTPSAVRDLFDINLLSTIPMLELCREQQIPFTLLSTSRVYSLSALRAIPLEVHQDAFRPQAEPSPSLQSGITEVFSQDPPLSLYGTSKRCSELLALELGATFHFPVWINRCGVLAGPGQFGKADQGIFSYWIHRWAQKRPLRYIGFGGHGWQVRDCLHPADITSLLLQQADAGLAPEKPRIVNLSGGEDHACSLRQLSAWCTERFGPHSVQSDPQERPFDLPWLVLNAQRAQDAWGWTPSTSKEALFESIATHAIAHPQWLQLCQAAD